MDFKLELVPIPVADVDRAKAFYAERAGFHVDFDMAAGNTRVVQLTPPGSACSILVSTGVVTSAPGSVQALHLVVADVHAARAELRDRGVDVGDVVEVKAEGKPTIRYAWFSDPDGNTWTLQSSFSRQ